MAVIIDKFDGTVEVKYEGCVLSTWERNGSWDSDFYAECWDEEKGEVVDVEYATTRAGCGCSDAQVDYTVDTLRKAYRYYYNTWRDHFDKYVKIRIAKTINTGDTVRVVRGKKIPKGTVGKVFWIGSTYNQYARREEERVGIEVDGKRVFLAYNYVEVVDWESRVVSGKARRTAIRNAAILRLNKCPEALMPLAVRYH